MPVCINVHMLRAVIARTRESSNSNAQTDRRRRAIFFHILNGGCSTRTLGEEEETSEHIDRRMGERTKNAIGSTCTLKRWANSIRVRLRIVIIALFVSVSLFSLDSHLRQQYIV